MLLDLSTKNKIFAGIEFPDPGGSGFANAKLVNVEMIRIKVNLRNNIVNL
jgi:hypothetical protein